jgi:hypothetical protein
MKITRDSMLLGLGGGAALVAYLMADGRSPAEWAYQDWLKLGAAGFAWVMGKLQTSPLKGEHDPAQLKGRY